MALKTCCAKATCSRSEDFLNTVGLRITCRAKQIRCVVCSQLNLSNGTEVEHQGPVHAGLRTGTIAAPAMTAMLSGDSLL